ERGARHEAICLVSADEGGRVRHCLCRAVRLGALQDAWPGDDRVTRKIRHLAGTKSDRAEPGGIYAGAEGVGVKEFQIWDLGFGIWGKPLVAQTKIQNHKSQMN